MFCPACGKELPDGSAFCLKCGKPTVAPQAPQKKGGVPPLRLIGIALLFFVLVGVYWSQNRPSPTPSKPTPNQHAPILVPMSTKLFTGQIIVKAGGYVTNKFTVDPSMRNFRVTGHFNASGGTGNDIQIVLADEDEFQNWINGHEAKVFYSTPKITTGKLDVGALGPGRYVLAFSNTFSTLTDKQIFAEVEANWNVQR